MKTKSQKIEISRKKSCGKNRFQGRRTHHEDSDYLAHRLHSSRSTWLTELGALNGRLKGPLKACSRGVLEGIWGGGILEVIWQVLGGKTIGKL